MTEMPRPGHLPAPIVLCRGICHYFGQGALRNVALQDVDLELPPGEIVLLTGPSGSGKSTLLDLIGGMIAVQQGQLQVLGIEMACLSSRQRVEVRRQIGFLVPELIESLTIAQNVEVALGHERLTARARQQRVEEALVWVGLNSRGGHRPCHLSGGQRQRVAIARALVHRPRLLLAEEPMTSLDQETGHRLIELLRQRAQEDGCTSLIVARDCLIHHEADRVIELECGRIVKNAPSNGRAADTERGHSSETGNLGQGQARR